MHHAHLHEEEQIRVLALRSRPLALLDVVVSDVNTLDITESLRIEKNAGFGEHGPS
jgi:hypothetical protein